ncbi:MAG: hypothetical protein QF699_07615, partial [Candidatus Poseidoniaceae archaeon]|nr:hypothetical protein [Candidatus Poseidoniaceae archaeon]
MAMLVGDTLYFDADDRVNGRELWAHDTSNHSTWQVTERLSSTGSTLASSNPGYSMAISIGDTMYLSMEATNATGYSFMELWAHDTSNHSTWQVADIGEGISSIPGYGELSFAVGDTLYFGARDGITGWEMWAHDTSNHSTWQVADINSGTGYYSDSDPGSYMAMLVGDTLYFDADDRVNGRELWAH